MITNEQWKQIKGFTRYEVSNTGKVRNIHTKKLKAIRTVKIGYCITDLKESGIKKTAYIHRLVAEAFIPNHDNLPQINHKDENKANNCVDNLEWCTSSYNLSYNGRAKMVGLHHREHSPTRKQIMCVETGKIFRSVSEAARQMNITRICISYVLSGKQKHAGGYSWVAV